MRSEAVISVFHWKRAKTLLQIFPASARTKRTAIRRSACRPFDIVMATAALREPVLVLSDELLPQSWRTASSRFHEPSRRRVTLRVIQSRRGRSADISRNSRSANSVQAITERFSTSWIEFAAAVSEKEIADASVFERWFRLSETQED